MLASGRYHSEEELWHRKEKREATVVGKRECLWLPMFLKISFVNFFVAIISESFTFVQFFNCKQSIPYAQTCRFLPPARTVSIHTPCLCPQQGACQLCDPFHPRYICSMALDTVKALPELPSLERSQSCASSLDEACHPLAPSLLPHCISCSLRVLLFCTPFYPPHI